MRNLFPKWIAMIALGCVAFVGVACGSDAASDDGNGGNGGNGVEPAEVRTRQVEIVLGGWEISDNWEILEFPDTSLLFDFNFEYVYSGLVAFPTLDDPSDIESAVADAQVFGDSLTRKVPNLTGTNSGVSARFTETIATYTEYCGLEPPVLGIFLVEADRPTSSVLSEALDASNEIGFSVVGSLLGTAVGGPLGGYLGGAITGFVLAKITDMLFGNDLIGNNMENPVVLQDGENTFTLSGKVDIVPPREPVRATFFVTKRTVSGSCDGG